MILFQDLWHFVFWCNYPRMIISVVWIVTPGLRSAPKKRCKTFIKRKRWCVEHPDDDARVANMAAEKAILCVLFEAFSEPDEICINTCLILQNTLGVTVIALAVQNKTEHPNQVKGSVETVIPNYCDPTFAWHFRMKRQNISGEG